MFFARTLKLGMNLSVECCIWRRLSSLQREGVCRLSYRGTRMFSWKRVWMIQTIACQGRDKNLVRLKRRLILDTRKHRPKVGNNIF